MESFWNAQAEWSRATFGSDQERGPQGPLKHLRKEVDEVLANPKDLEEYADLLFLVFDATRRAGFSYLDLDNAAWMKLEKNKMRKWPKPTTDEPVEHVRDERMMITEDGKVYPASWGETNNPYDHVSD